MDSKDKGLSKSKIKQQSIEVSRENEQESLTEGVSEPSSRTDSEQSDNASKETTERRDDSGDRVLKPHTTHQSTGDLHKNATEKSFEYSPETNVSHSKTISEQQSIKALQENEEDNLIEGFSEPPSQKDESLLKQISKQQSVEALQEDKEESLTEGDSESSSQTDKSLSKSTSKQQSIEALQENVEESLPETVSEPPSQTVSEQSDTTSKETKVRRVSLGDRVLEPLTKHQSTGALHEYVEENLTKKSSDYSSETSSPSRKVKLTRSVSLQRAPSHLTIYDSLKRNQTLKSYLESVTATNTLEEREEPVKTTEADILSTIVSENSDGSTQDYTSLKCIECVKAVPVFLREEIDVGDHIIFAGRIYDHHGIVVAKPDNGNKLTIVEATNTISGVTVGFFVGRKAVLASSDKEFDFARQKIWRVHYRKRVFSKVEVADRAVKFKDDTYKYDLMDNNCEHFATFCVTGKKFSIQVTKLRLTFRLFLNSGFRGISDELTRNKREYENNIICKECYDMNTILLSVEVKPITESDQVKAGDIIRYSYWNLWHDAVVLQVKDEQPKYIICEIAHYAFCGLLSHRQIIAEDLQIYFDGKRSKLDYKSPEYNVYDPETVVKRARRRLGEQEFVFFSNDSSHYSRWCKLRLEKPVDEPMG